MSNFSLPAFAKPVEGDMGRAAPAFSIATLVTDPAQYEAMTNSFIAGGFTPDTCEYLAIDNTNGSQSQTDAFTGLNRAISQASAPYVILCHQDVRLLDDNRAVLEARLNDLDEHYPKWALAGNAGGIAPGKLALRLSDPHAHDQSIGPFPVRVTTLDENFIVLRRAANIGFSHDLEGFHLYGADICLTADVMGRESYVIDFHLAHLSPGNKDRSFAVAKRAFQSKWSRALRPRWLQTTCTLVAVMPTTLAGAAASLIDPVAEKLWRRLPGARGWTPKRRTDADKPKSAAKAVASLTSDKGPTAGEAVS